MNGYLVYIVAGIIFCLSGVVLFQLKIFEENKKLLVPFLLTAAGVVLIGIGTAKYLHLV